MVKRGRAQIRLTHGMHKSYSRERHRSTSTTGSAGRWPFGSNAIRCLAKHRGDIVAGVNEPLSCPADLGVDLNPHGGKISDLP